MFQPTHLIRHLPRCSPRTVSTTARSAAVEARPVCTRSFGAYKPSSRLTRPIYRGGRPYVPIAARPASVSCTRPFHLTARCRVPTDYTSESAISMDRYHEIADETMDDIFTKLEERAELEKELDVEFSAGVLTLDTPNGTYVINKQPPNKQIWLSSPVSGPKRYDWVERDGEWVYSRDSSTLRGLLVEEIGISWDD